MNKTYEEPFEGWFENPHTNLAGDYSSFQDIIDKLEKVNLDFRNNLTIIGSAKNGYSIALPGTNLGSVGGQSYATIGEIIPPLVQDDEEVRVEPLSNMRETFSASWEESWEK